MKLSMDFFKKASGFTLVELLAVLIILAILAAISAPIYMEYVKSARAADAQTTIGAILTADKIYYQKYGEYTTNIEQLDIRIEASTKLKWNFEIGASTNDITSLQATSTEKMPGGAGKVISYDVKTGEFHGYGIDD